MLYLLKKSSFSRNFFASDSIPSCSFKITYLLNVIPRVPFQVFCWPGVILCLRSVTSTIWAQLLEAWLALTSVKYLDNVLVLILLNQWLKLTMLWATQARNTCTYKWYCISYSCCNQEVPNLTIENEQQISRLSSYLVWTNFNEMKKAYFQYQYRCLFQLIANEQYTNHLSVN